MAYRKLGRNSSNRKALFRSILSSFIKHERIETTVTKAKEVSSHVAKLITLAKQGDLHARRQVLAVLVDEEATRKLFDEIAPKYAERQGGFTRIYRVGPRRGDAAEMAIIEHENQELLFLVFLLLLVGNSQRDTVNSQVALAIQDKKDV